MEDDDVYFAEPEQIPGMSVGSVLHPTLRNMWENAILRRAPCRSLANTFLCRVVQLPPK
jgi:hypothetical protein